MMTFAALSMPFKTAIATAFFLTMIVGLCTCIYVGKKQGRVKQVLLSVSTTVVAAMLLVWQGCSDCSSAFLKAAAEFYPVCTYGTDCNVYQRMRYFKPCIPKNILWTIALYFGRFVVIVQSGCISGLNSASHLKYFSSGNEKRPAGNDPKPAISSYSVIIMRIFTQNSAISVHKYKK